MDNGLTSIYLSRILSGFYIFQYKEKKYKLVYPDCKLKYSAELYCQEEYEQNKYNDWIKDEDILSVLIDLKLWSHNGDQELKNIETKIEDLKIELYHNFLNPAKIKNIKKSIHNAQRAYEALYDNRHCLDTATLKGYCGIIKSQYILVNSLYSLDDKKIFEDLNIIDYSLVNDISFHINKDIINTTIFRTIARSEVWRNYWSANKHRIFDKPTIDWTDEQKTLIILSKMYDSAFEHPDCPPDSVVQDDDMFDGWMILSRRQNEKDREKNRNEKMLNNKKVGNAQEVFLVANSKEEAQNIYSLNDNTSKNIINERNKIVMRSNQDIKEADLPDVQRNLLIKNNQQFMQSRKK
jgi:hypothetical protein